MWSEGEREEKGGSNAYGAFVSPGQRPPRAL